MSFLFPTFFLKKIYLFIYLFNVSQKRTSDPIADGCEPPCCWWELNSERLEEQSVLLTTEPSLQLPLPYLFASYVNVDCYI